MKTMDITEFVNILPKNIIKHLCEVNLTEETLFFQRSMKDLDFFFHITMLSGASQDFDSIMRIENIIKERHFKDKWETVRCIFMPWGGGLLDYRKENFISYGQKFFIKRWNNNYVCVKVIKYNPDVVTTNALEAIETPEARYFPTPLFAMFDFFLKVTKEVQKGCIKDDTSKNGIYMYKDYSKIKED